MYDRKDYYYDPVNHYYTYDPDGYYADRRREKPQDMLQRQ